jgi:anti-sigma regulatory factor (Ser/Thr protein kinase)
MSGKKTSFRAKITLCAELESLPTFRDFIDQHCRPLPAIDEAILYDLKLALDEACTNIISHGYAGMDPGSIMLELVTDRHKIILNITDFGHPFEPSEALQPDVEAALGDHLMGGFGLYFIYQTMDEVCYNSSEDGNCLTLEKNLPEKSGRI